MFEMEQSDKHDGSIDDKLYEAAASGDVTGVVDLLQAGANPDHIGNPFGQWTALHAACANNRPEVVGVLIESKASVLAVDRNKHTPIHIACSFGYMECLRAFKTRMDSLQGLVVSRDDGVSPLALAVEKEKLDAVKYLVAVFKLDPEGISDALLKLCCSKGDLSFIKELIYEFHCEPKEANDAVLQLCCEEGDLDMTTLMVTKYKCVPTADNLVASCEKVHNKIVSYLLADMNCDPNQKNNFGQTPLTQAKDRKIIQLLLKHGAATKDAYAHHRRSLGLLTSKNPLDNPVKMFVIGYGGEGKSTLVEAMQHEKLKRAAAVKEVTGVSQQTAGIVPKIFNSTKYGCVQFFDCAGQAAFHSSHASIIKTCVLSSPPVFILVTGLHKDDKYTKQSIAYWLDIVVNQCIKMEGKAPLIVVGSHADIVLKVDVNRKEKIIVSVAEKYLQLDFTKFVAMDCRIPGSEGMKVLREVVGRACSSIRSKLSVNLNSHMFLIYLLDKYREENVTTLERVQSEIESQESSKKDKNNLLFIPIETHRLVDICSQLNDKGHILFLHDTKHPLKSSIIIDKSILMTKINGTMFAPTNFREHCQLATSTGIVPRSKLVEQFPEENIDMIIGFLSQHELAVPIKDEEVLQRIKEQVSASGVHESPDEAYLFCPGLIRLEAANEIWKQSYQQKHYFGWTISCSKSDQFFSGQLFQVLLLRLALTLKLAVSIDNFIPSLQQYCSVWKTGIHWQTNDNISIIVQLGENSKSIDLLMRTQKISLEFLQLRSDIVNKVRKATKQYCPVVKTTESLIDPNGPIDYPLQPCSQEKLFSLKHLAESIVNCKETVVNLYQSMSIQELLQAEVYAGLGENLLQALFNETQPMFTETLSDKFLDVIVSKWEKQPCLLSNVILAFSKRNFSQRMTIKNCFLTAIKCWQSSTEGNYKCFKTVLDTMSVFAGKSPLELAGLEVKPFSSEVLFEEAAKHTAFTGDKQVSKQTICLQEELRPRSFFPPAKLDTTDVSIARQQQPIHVPYFKASSSNLLESVHTSQHSRHCEIPHDPNCSAQMPVMPPQERRSSQATHTDGKACSPLSPCSERLFSVSGESYPSMDEGESIGPTSPISDFDSNQTSFSSYHSSVSSEVPAGFHTRIHLTRQGSVQPAPCHTHVSSTSNTVLLDSSSQSSPEGPQNFHFQFTQRSNSYPQTVSIQVDYPTTPQTPHSPAFNCPSEETLIESAKKTGVLNTSFLNLLTNRLWDVRSCWNNFGIQLNVKKSTLEAIDKDHCSVDDCFKRMLHEFLQQENPPPRVADVIEALESKPVNYANLVANIKDLLE